MLISSCWFYRRWSCNSLVKSSKKQGGKKTFYNFYKGKKSNCVNRVDLELINVPALANFLLGRKNFRKHRKNYRRKTDLNLSYLITCFHSKTIGDRLKFYIYCGLPKELSPRAKQFRYSLDGFKILQGMETLLHNVGVPFKNSESSGVNKFRSLSFISEDLKLEFCRIEFN